VLEQAGRPAANAKFAPRLVGGAYRLASRYTSEKGVEESLQLGVLRVFPANAEPDAPHGQWVFWLDASLEARPATILVEVAARLGLLPVHFSAEFEERLRDAAPLCLVADTNTLYHGSLFQALSLRKAKATHVALADQVLMELQKQRETAYLKKKSTSAPAAGSTAGTPSGAPPVSKWERWVRASRRATCLAAGGRTLRRIREAGHIVHVARPPEAMVRYFGGGRHAGEGDADGSDEDALLVGSNALRDRLILEAAIQQRISLPGVPVWLLTDDALLAAQAAIEGVSVGFAWLPAVSTSSPAVLTSPFFSVRSLQLHHVTVDDFLDELLWSTGNISLQREGEARALTAKLSTEKRDRVLSEMGESSHRVTWTEERVDGWSLGSTVPQKSPSPKAMVAALVAGLAAPVPTGTGDAERYVFSYLDALGWIDKSGNLTPRGRALAQAWMGLDYADADAWAGWLDDAARDVRRLRTIAAAVAELEKAGSATDQEVADRLGTSVRTVAAQLGLASAFGISVRLGAKGRPAGEWTTASAEAAVLSAIRTSLASAAAGVTAVNIGKLFAFMQRTEVPAIPFHVFRRALLQLEKGGRVVFSGSVPEAGGGVVIHVLRPSTTDERVELPQLTVGSGGSIAVGRSAKVVQLQGSPP
jgi:hypothetical protein